MTCPSLGSKKPPKIRNKVVFPHPLGPNRVTNSFSYISKSIPFNTTCHQILSQCDEIELIYSFPVPSILSPCPLKYRWCR